MNLLSILKFLKPVEVIKTLKGSDKRKSIKTVLLMSGSGALIPAGLGMITLGAETYDKYQLLGGTILLCVGAVLAIVLSNQVKTIQNGESTAN
tara:strand:+ start:283 stop:561 length:279 start_codon:yes stop_codon:yes gene_type:complete